MGIDKSKWPRNVRTLGISATDYMGQDDDGNLYWDGQPLAFKHRFTFTWWQGLGAVVVAVSTLGMFVLDLLRYLAAP